MLRTSSKGTKLRVNWGRRNEREMVLNMSKRNANRYAIVSQISIYKEAILIVVFFVVVRTKYFAF